MVIRTGKLSRELEQAAQVPWGNTQSYPQVPQLWHANLGVPGALEDLYQALLAQEERWQQHILAVPVPA